MYPKFKRLKLSREKTLPCRKNCTGSEAAAETGKQALSWSLSSWGLILKNKINPGRTVSCSFGICPGPWPPGLRIEHLSCSVPTPRAPLYRDAFQLHKKFLWEHPVISAFVYGSSSIWRRLKSLMRAEETTVYALLRILGPLKEHMPLT